MARQRSDAPTSTDGADQSSRAASTDELWSAARIDVVEIALPGGAGYTLRAYRSDEEVEGTDISDREVEAFPDRHRTSRVYDHDEKALHDDEVEETQDHDFDRDFAAEDTDTGELDPAELDDLDEVDAGTDSDSDPDTDSDADGDDDAEEEDDEEDEDGEDEEEEEVEAEEIPIFLGYRGKLLLFKSPEGLVDFVKSGAPHDMEQLEGWSEVVEKVTAEDIDPLPEDTYELDLVVKNLRGSRDTWDAELLIRAGEIARDLGRSFEIETVEKSLVPGSPLDDLDDALRASVAGGVGGFLGRRRLKKIGTEAAPLSWRTIIGKISDVVDWRD